MDIFAHLTRAADQREGATLTADNVRAILGRLQQLRDENDRLMAELDGADRQIAALAQAGR